MNERFKFRVKQKDDFGGQWEYFSIPSDLQKEGLYMSEDAYDWKTLGQCTGLKDKNGKLIYEGDILEEDDCNAGCSECKKEKYQKSRYVVGIGHTRDAKFGVNLNYWNHEEQGLSTGEKELKSLIKIGNIYENPSLLNILSSEE